jgi:hypothetical protein
MKLYTDLQNTAGQLAMILAPRSSKQNELEENHNYFVNVLLFGSTF